VDELEGQIAVDLPIQATPFVGRRSEVETVQVLLGKRRLVTLVGSGGCGKTRLAIEVASTQPEYFEEGVWFVDFSPLTAGEQVTRAVADALSIKGEPEKSLIESVIASLKSGRRLLLLDNCEHLLDACAEFASVMLSHCHDVYMLATSRELLSVRGETMFRVPSLSVTDQDAPTAADVLKTESGRLFLECANRQLFDFEIDEKNAALVADICLRLDGIPLAIELAAAQIRTLSLAEIHDSLNDCFRILTSGERSALPRQRTILATIEWSADRLEPEQRLLLHRLSVFTGGFTLAAVDVICGEGKSQLPALLALADKNLILAREAGKGDRRRLLETVRQFAHNHLVEDGDGEQILRRHRDYFQQMASDARPEKHQDSAGWLSKLSFDRNNLRGAIEWSLEQSDGIEPGLRIAADLGWYWYQQGQLLEGSELLLAGLAKPLEGVTANTRLDALYTLGWLLNSLGKSHEAGSKFKEMAGMAIEIGDRLHEAEALNGLALAAFHKNYEEAKAYFEEALDINRSLPNGGSSISNLNNLCLLSMYMGDREEAHKYGEETVKLARQKDRPEVEGVALFLLAVNAGAMEENDRASELFQEAQRILRKHGFRQRLLHTLVMHADHCMDIEDAQAAHHMYREAFEICQELNAKPIEHQVLCGLGSCLAVRGRSAESRRLLGKGLEICKAVEDKSHLARALENASVYFAANHEAQAAARLLGAAWKQRELHPGRIAPNSYSRSERLSRPIRDAIGDTAFDNLFEEGFRLTAIQAIALALDMLADSSGAG